MTRCANCGRPVPPEPAGVLVLCDAWCYGIWTARNRGGTS